MKSYLPRLIALVQQLRDEEYHTIAGKNMILYRRGEPDLD